MQPTPTRRRHGALHLALALVASALTLVVGPAVGPVRAEAAPAPSGQPCAPGEGVTVVVDFQHVGGRGIQVGCATGPQDDGFAALTNAGFGLNDDPSALAGTICQIEGIPAAGYPACWYDGFWGYWKSDGSQPWTWSNVGASHGPLAVDRVEGWSWTSPIPSDYSGAPMGLAVADLADLLLGEPACDAVPQLPTFDIVSSAEVLPVTLADGHPVEVALLADGADPSTATWAEATSVALAGHAGSLRILARRAGTECPDAPMFDATYDVRGSYSPRWNAAAGTPGGPSPAIDKADPRIVGWITGHSEYTPGGNVSASFQTPTSAYGPITSSLVVLGDRGSYTATFDAPITNGPGYDLAAFENGFASGANDFLEVAYLEVSSNGTDFVRFDSASRRTTTVAAFGTQDPGELGGLPGKDLSGKGTPFDLSVLKNKPEVRSGQVDLGRITHVRLKDIQGDGADLDSFGRPIYDPNPVTGSAGYDLTGIGVLNALDEVAPVVKITAAPTGSVVDTDAEIAFSVDDPESTVEYQLDAGDWSAAASPLTLSGLTPGSHTVAVRATDASGNVGTASASWTVLGPRDCLVGPWLPDLGIVDSKEVLPVRLADGHAVELAVLADGADPASASYAVANELDLAPYEGQVVRVLARGADDSCAEAPTFDATYDVRNGYAPRWDRTPAPGTPSPAVAATDPAIVAWASGYENYQPGENVAATWKTPERALGPVGSFSDLVVLGDRGRIDLTFADPIRNGDGDDLAVFENGFAVNGANPVDFLELGRVAVSTDGVTWATFDSASRRTDPVGAFQGQAPEELGGLAGKDLDGRGTPFDLERLKNQPEVRSGAVNLDNITRVRIIDVVGDGNDVDSFGRPIYDPYPTSGSGGFDLKGVGALHVAPRTPVVTITSAPDAVTAETEASIAFTVAPDDGATAECRLDGGTWEACTSPVSLAALAEGAHTYEVRGSRMGVTGDAASTSWTVEVIPPSTPDEAWVQAAYEDFLDRAPTAAELDASVARIEGGTARATIARELSTSDEWLSVIVTAFYTDTLGRAPDPSGLAFWVQRLRTGRVTVAQAAANFYSSAEYYREIGGNTPATWVDDLYLKLLGRPADDAGRSYWVGRVSAKGRSWVAEQFYGSAESRRARVTGLYLALLGRAPDAAGRDFWAARIASQGDLALAVHLAASGEYRSRAQVRFP